MKGLFITFEGLEGSGKSTQIKKLAQILTQKKYSVVVTREPGGTRIGEQIRAITHDVANSDLTALSESYLMAAARAQHVAEVIQPALKEGKIVLCDRFLDSSRAYQGAGRGLGIETIETLNTLAVNGCTPDLTIYLMITPEIGQERRKKTDKQDRLDMQDDAFYARVQRGYEKIIEKDPTRFLVLNAEEGEEVIAQMIWNSVAQILKRK